MTDYELHVCGNCAAFGMNTRNVETEDDGACRLNPPQNLPANDGEYITAFPSVNQEEWCLSWVPKDVT